MFIKSCFWWSIFPLKYQNTYGQETFQGGDIPWETSSKKFAWHLNRLILWGQVTNKIHVSICRRPMGTVLNKVLTYCERLTPLKSHDPLMTWPMWGHVTIWKCISPLLQDLWPLILTGSWLLEGGSARKRLSRHRLLALFLYSKSGRTGKIVSIFFSIVVFDACDRYWIY